MFAMIKDKAGLRIGSRGSDLAIAQSRMFMEALSGLSLESQPELQVIVTSGDKKQGLGESAFRDKVDWISEIQSALVCGEIRCALHSGKDVPIDISSETSLLPICARGNPFDAIVQRADASSKIESLAQVPRGGTVGTASLRRGAQVKHFRQDLNVVPIRGNVPTRIQKLDSGECDVLILAAAGLERLSLQGRISALCSAEELLPAVNQGTLVAQYLSDDSEMEDLLKKLCFEDLRQCWVAERAVVRTLQADCHSAVGVFASPKKDIIEIKAQVLSTDGVTSLLASADALPQEAELFGVQVGNKLLEQGAAELLSNR